MTKPRVFISFAGEDEDARKLLGEELDRQRTIAYDYSVPHVGSQVGMRLAEQIAGEIDRAELFVALASDRSTAPDKSIIHAEVRRALARSLLERGRLMVVLLHAPRPFNARRIEARKPGCSRSPESFQCIAESRLLDAGASDPGAVFIERLADGVDQPEPVKLRVRDARDQSEITLKGWAEAGRLFFAMDEWQKLEVKNPPVFDYLSPLAKSRWMGAFAEIQPHVCTHVEEIHPGCFDALGQTICQRLGLSHQRPAPADSRLPFYQKLHEEILSLPVHGAVSLLRGLDFFNANTVVGSWKEALINVRALRMLLRQRGAENDSYYASVIEGVCRLRLRELNEALEVFERCCEDTRCDENAWSCRAKALFALQRPAAALASARRAIDICTAKLDPAPFARLDRLTMAVEIANSPAVREPALDAEIRMAFRDAVDLLDQPRKNMGIEDTIKVKKLTAGWLQAEGRIPDALKACELLTSSVHADLAIPGECFTGFPELSGNRFFAVLADAGLFFDEPGRRCRQRLRIVGSRDDFWIVEDEVAYRFTVSESGRWSLRYTDTGIVNLTFLLRTKAGEMRDEWLRDLEAGLNLFPGVHLFRTVFRGWCERGDLEKARSTFHAAERTGFGEDPYLLQDAASLYAATGDRHLGARLMARSADVCSKLLRTAQTGCEWTPADLLLAWARARDFSGDHAGVLSAIRLGGLRPEDL